MDIGRWVRRHSLKRSNTSRRGRSEPTIKEFRSHVRKTIDYLDGAREDEIEDLDDEFIWWLINNGYITYEIDEAGYAVFHYTGKPV